MSYRSSTKHRFFWGVFIVILGVLLLLNNYNLLDFGDLIANFWPLILVAVGLRMIFGAKSIRNRHKIRSVSSEDTISMSVDKLSESRFIGEIHLRIDHDQFRGGSVSNFIGDITLDLSDVKLAEGEQNLTISGFIGDVTFIPPTNEAYHISASLTIGDLLMSGHKDEGFGVSRDFKTTEYDSAAARLNINISYFIGEVKVL